jgi:hypothetical protein
VWLDPGAAAFSGQARWLDIEVRPGASSGAYTNPDFDDINPFVLYLSNFAAWQAAYQDCPPENGDINPFVVLLTG